jgi:lysophospholipase L1-like esterase
MLKNSTKINITMFFALMACGTVILSSCIQREIRNIDSRGKNIICFGDSITFGVGVKRGEDYPSILGKMTGIPVINAGIDGEISSEAVKRLKTDCLDKAPLLVIIEFGGNDFLRQLPLEETIKNMEEMIKAILARGAMVAIADISNNIIMSDYGDEYRRLSEKYNTILIPRLVDGIITSSSLKTDLVHPNSAGYKIITHRIYRAILPYINQNAILKRLRG